MAELVLLYVPTEDRILLDYITLPKKESLWITRVISKKIVAKITDISTETHSNNLNYKERVMKNNFERDIAQSRTPIKKNEKKFNDEFIEKISNINNTVKQFEIKKNENSRHSEYEVQFSDEFKIILKIKMNMQHLLNFQTTLMNKIETAKW